MCPPVNLAHAEEPVSTCSAKNLTSVWIMQFPDNDLTALRQQHVYLWLCEVCATFAALLLRLLGFKSPWNPQYLLIFLHFKLRNWNTTLLNVFVSAKSIEWPPQKNKGMDPTNDYQYSVPWSSFVVQQLINNPHSCAGWRVPSSWIMFILTQSHKHRPAAPNTR